MKNDRLAEPDLLKGTGYVMVAFFSMAIFGVCIKLATADVSKIWISFFIYLTAFLSSIPYVWRVGFDVFKTKYPSYHVGRMIFGLSASCLYIVALNHLPLVNAALLFYTTPLFIPFLAVPMLNESVSKHIWWAVVLGFIGIAIIIKPNSQIFLEPGNIIGLLSGFCLAVAYIFIKKLSPVEKISRIVFLFFFLATLIQVPFLFFADFLPPLTNLFYAFIAGVCFLISQIFLAKAYEYAPAAKIGVFQYFTILYVAIFDWLLWNKVLSLVDLIGALLIIVAGVIIIKMR